MTDTPITREAIKQLAKICGELGNRAHERIGHGDYMRALWSAETMLPALRDELDRVTARVAELEAALSALVSVTEGYQQMPGYSLHPMTITQIASAHAALRTDKGDG